VSTETDTVVFEGQRSRLLAHAYRMLGDVGRAEDIIQDAWLRWRGRQEAVDDPKSFLLTIVTRLCLNELDSARYRKEESRADRLPEPIDLRQTGLDRLETLDRISMAFVVVLQRLTPAERAVLLLHDVFDLSHAEVARNLGRSEEACRQLLSRARQNVQEEKRVFETSKADEERLLHAFVQASNGGNQQEMLELLADDATMVIDTGLAGGRVGRIRNVGKPIHGRKRIAAFLAAVASQGEDFGTAMPWVLNGEPAVALIKDGAPRAAIFVSVADGRVRHVFVQADPAKLASLGARVSLS
jgi:RNA polymerase sigma-70 factor (ECF subfamily)